MSSRFILAYDPDADGDKWFLFDRTSALETASDWCGVDRARKSMSANESNTESAPAWTPKSGGY